MNMLMQSAKVIINSFKLVKIIVIYILMNIKFLEFSNAQMILINFAHFMVKVVKTFALIMVIA